MITDLTYNEFINNILETRGRFACGDEYHERHHILPKCMGGGSEEDNLIDLFAKEHLIAHKLLAQENPDNYRLVYAWICMSSMKSKYHERYEATPEEYEAIMETKRGLMKNLFTKETRNKMSKAQKERFSNPDERKKYSEMFSGENGSFYGKCHSEETKKKQSESKRGKNNPNYGKRYSDEEKQRLSKLLSGENNPIYGKPRSEETRRKISLANTNPSETTRQKMREAKLGLYEGGKSPGAKAVVCLETKNVYEASSVASKKTGINKKNICQCCRGEKKTAGGYKWKFVYDTTRKNGDVVLGALSLGLITEDEVFKQMSEIK
jgi:hypothetical protein